MKLDLQRTARLFEKLMLVAPELKLTSENAKSSVPGLMDLHLNVLDRDGEYRQIALTHKFTRQSGEIVIELEMQVSVFFADKLAEALTYLDQFEFQNAYAGADELPNLVIHTAINRSLEHWLDMLAMQGYVMPRGN